MCKVYIGWNQSVSILFQIISAHIFIFHWVLIHSYRGKFPFCAHFLELNNIYNVWHAITNIKMKVFIRLREYRSLFCVWKLGVYSERPERLVGWFGPAVWSALTYQKIIYFLVCLFVCFEFVCSFFSPGVWKGRGGLGGQRRGSRGHWGGGEGSYSFHFCDGILDGSWVLCTKINRGVY